VASRADAEVLYGTAHPMSAQLTTGQTELLIALGRSNEARPLLERAIPILTAGASPDKTALAKFTIAQLVEPSDHERAITLATEAEVALRQDPAWAADRANVAAWVGRQTKRRR